MALASDKSGEIAACPFCKMANRQRVLEYSQRGIKFRVVCITIGCDATGPYRHDWFDAVDAWNAGRSPQPQPAEPK